MTESYNYITGCPCDFCKAEQAHEAADKAAAEQLVAAAPVVAPTSRLLTKEMVLKGSPCYEYRSLFSERYGENGVEVTVEKALSESNDWDWEWAGAILLSRKAKAEFSRRSREAAQKYDSTMRPYWDLTNAAYDEYYRVRDQAAIEASTKGLNYGQRYDYTDKASVGIMDVPEAAAQAADEIAAKLRTDARITAFVELFITDGAAYEEEHKNDEPVYDPGVQEGDTDDDFWYNNED